MEHGDVLLRFNAVTFEYVEDRPLLEDACFGVRERAKVTIMGQNGGGKSTIFKLITGELQPKTGTVNVRAGARVAIAQQVMPTEAMDKSVTEYFATAFDEKKYDLEKRISEILTVVNLSVPHEKLVRDLSGGQQARLLLAYALIQNQDILLLDEPTNNLDQEGIDHLIQFLVMYQKTVIVISHDADFLNCFTEGVLYLDVHTKKIESYVGDYYSVVEEIQKRIEREIKKNAQLEKSIQDNKDKVNFFAHKGGKMRKLASKLKEETEEMERNKVDVRRDDKTIREFTIPNQKIVGDIVTIDSVKIIKNHEPVVRDVHKILRQKSRLRIEGPNGIGKSTLLRSLIDGTSDGVRIMEGTRVGYYSQDFSMLDFNETVFDSLENIKEDGIDTQEMRSVAAGFLITGDLMGHRVSNLSEGQKGLLSFARLVLMRPGLLVLDEPTNHINFRHIPVIVKAIQGFQGAIILISHMPDFVKEII